MQSFGAQRHTHQRCVQGGFHMAKVIHMAGTVPRRWAALLSFVLATGAALIFVQSVLAVNQNGRFELDGNADSGPSGPPDDWDRVCYQVLTSSGIPNADSKCGASMGT